MQYNRYKVHRFLSTQLNAFLNMCVKLLLSYLFSWPPAPLLQLFPMPSGEGSY